ncbi:hypothetical protein Moror_5360 [Moniliophthora roreri MCA 2997]|uniref:DUF6534 domain-containing protein n=1 Tax=Moniliophthora roreri (strain MCA 2997) TaxID=1381753 RepID=V2XQR1_MONRO|nr:hypothetical protein Moror_5360 [Moniliophthora roreri MCA 2997]
MATPFMSIVQPDLEGPSGADLVATIISSCLYGVTCIQTWYYFQNYSDSILIRATVLTILALETIHAVLLTQAMYHYLILNYGNPSALLTHTWTTILINPTMSPIATIVLMFYAVRIYLFSYKRDWWTPAIVCILNAVQTAFSIALTVGMAKHHFFAVITTNKQSIAISVAPLFCTAAGDVICAVALSYYLHSNCSGIKSTNTRINKLIIHAINNGVLNVVAAISTVVFKLQNQRTSCTKQFFKWLATCMLTRSCPSLTHETLTPASETSRLTQAVDTLTIDIAKILNEPEPVTCCDQQDGGSFGMEVNLERGVRIRPVHEMEGVWTSAKDEERGFKVLKR